MALPSLRKTVWGGLALFFFLLGLFAMLSGGASGNMILGGFGVIVGAFFAVIAGIIFAAVFLGDISAWGVDCLLAPRRFLKKAPPLMTQVEALIKREQFELALKRLDEMIGENPDIVRLHSAKFDLLMIHLQRPEEALTAAEAYFRQPKRYVSEGNAELLLRYVEFARAMGMNHDAEQLLHSELKRRRTGYTRLERERIGNALKALTEGVDLVPYQAIKL